MIYMFKNKIILLLLSLALVGCGYKETTLQSRDVGYLKFKKSASNNYTVVVNDTYTFTLTPCTQKDVNAQCVDETNDNIYEVSSGNIKIKIYNNHNTLIMSKEAYLGSSNTMEIDLP